MKVISLTQVGYCGAFLEGDGDDDGVGDGGEQKGMGWTWRVKD